MENGKLPSRPPSTATAAPITPGWKPLNRIQLQAAPPTEIRVALAELIRDRNRRAALLTAAMLAVYFGFIFLIAFAPGVFRIRLGGVPLGIPLAVGVIAGAFLLSAVHVRWANGTHDRRAEEIRRKLRERP